MQYSEIVVKGDENGNGMIVRFRLPSGLEIYGLPTRNFYGGHWDLGPTWNYLVMADRPFLVDAGRYGQGAGLVRMMESVGIAPTTLDFVLISHGHEDHDGGLAELVRITRLKVKAHAVYDRLIRQYPQHAPAQYKANFPAKCWHCFMPESFYTENCLGYHRVLRELPVDVIADGEDGLGPEISTCHLPGHSPDCLCVVIGDEALIVGDVVLPDISPWPTREAMFEEVRDVLGPHYPQAGLLFGLKCYIRSLKQLSEINKIKPDITVLPAHRLYYGNRWNAIRLAERIDELLAHHIQRCGAILDILRAGPKSADEIAGEHFEARQLEGYGKLMAANEVVSHCELMGHCGDVIRMADGRYAAAGSTFFEALIHDIRS